MDEQIQRAFDAYRVAVQAERSLSEDIAAENRRPTPEEQEQFERMEEDIASARREYERLRRIDARRAELDEARSAIASLIAHEPATSPDATVRSLPQMWAEIRSGGRTSVADFAYNERALAKSSSTVDASFYDRVVVYERTFTPMLNPDVVTILATTRGENLTIPRLTADTSAGGTVTAEAGTISAADPTISSVTLGAFKYASINLWSAELDTDEVVGLEDLMARSTGRDLGIGAGAHLTTGTGTVQPFGIVNQASNGGTATGTANNTFFGPADIIDLFYGRAAPYRTVGTWMASSTGLAKIRKFVNSNGDFIWAPGLGGQPDTVLGRPIFENPAMAAVGSASKSVLFGDTSRYFTRRVSPGRVELSRDYKFDTDQVALKTVERIDGNLVDVAAVAYLVSANA